MRPALLIAFLLLAGCATAYQASTVAVKTGGVAYQAFLRYDGERELAIARAVIAGCKTAPDPPSCMDHDLAAERAKYDAVKAPVVRAIVAYRSALKSVDAGLAGDLPRAVADLISALAAIGVEVPR